MRTSDRAMPGRRRGPWSSVRSSPARSPTARNHPPIVPTLIPTEPSRAPPRTRPRGLVCTSRAGRTCRPVALRHGRGAQVAARRGDGADPAHRLDIHLPVESNGLAVLWLHAGGWTAGDRTGTGPVADQFVADGAVVFSADYRLTPAHVFPAQIHDVKRAIRWIKCHRADYPYRRLVVAGASAGGHLAVLAATSAGAFEPADLPPQRAAHDSSVDGSGLPQRIDGPHPLRAGRPHVGPRALRWVPGLRQRRVRLGLDASKPSAHLGRPRATAVYLAVAPPTRS